MQRVLVQHPLCDFVEMYLLALCFYDCDKIQYDVLLYLR